jgi:outer membrane receptor protein involved in Fe transport
LNTSASWDVREVPGNVMVYTSDDIAESGANDLMDFLQLIPGLSIAQHRDQSPGINVRGVPGNEGRVMIAINNLPLNETGTGSFALAQRINLRNVARIEITYGPGNIVNGSGSFLASVNVILKNANDAEGADISGSTTLYRDGLSMEEASLLGNHFVGKDATLTYTFRRSNGVRNSDYFNKKTVPFLSIEDPSRVSNAEAFMQLVTKNFTIGYFESDYSYGRTPENFKINSQARMLDLSHVTVGKNSFSLRNNLRYSQQMPWHYEGIPDSLYNLSNLQFNRSSFSSILTYNFNRRLYLSALFEAARTSIVDNLQQDIPSINKNSWFKNDPSVYAGVAGLDFLYTSKIGLFNIAARSEWGTLSKILISPRFSYSRLKGPIHFKFMVAKSYRVPEIRNYIFSFQGDSVIPEKLQSIQIQTGYNFSAKHKVLLNGFYSEVLNPIKQFYAEGLQPYYRNLSQVNSYGFELTYQMHIEKFHFRASYSYNDVFDKQTNRTKSDTSLYNANEYFGLPVNSLSLSSNWSIGERNNLIISGLMQGPKRYAELHSETTINVHRSDPTWIFNAVFRTRLMRSGELMLEVGMMNILDQKQLLCCSSGDFDEPIPFNTRQFRLSLTYSLLR